MTCTRRRFLYKFLFLIAYLAGYFGLGPDEGGCIKYVEIVEPLIPIVSAVEIDLVAVDSGSMVVPARRNRSEGLRFTPIIIEQIIMLPNESVKIKDI